MLTAVEDTKMLCAAYHISMSNCVELSVIAWRLAGSNLYRKATPLPGCVSLADLCEIFTDIRLHKDKTIPDWNIAHLTDDMILCKRQILSH